MKKPSVSAFIHYLFPPVDNFLKALIILIAGTITAIFEVNPWVIAIFAILAIIEMRPDASKIIRFFSSVRYIKSVGKLWDVALDFAESEPYMNGKVRAGKKYIFGKKCGAIISYSEIRRGHHFLRKNYGYSKKRFIEIFTLDGGRHKLCKVSGDDKMATEAEIVMKLLRDKAPKAEISLK